MNGCTAPEFKFTSNGKFTRNSSQFTLVDSITGESTLWTYSDNTLTIDDSRDFATRSVLVFTKDAVTQPRT